MILAGTGHRPPAIPLDYSSVSREKLCKFAVEQLRKIDAVKKVITGMATGWDQAIAHAAYNMRIPFIAAVPFEGQEVKWPSDGREYFYRLLKKAEDIIVVCESGYANWKFFERDKWMVDHSDAVFALWNDASTGGTAITIQYAKKIGKPVINNWEDWQKWIYT